MSRKRQALLLPHGWKTTMSYAMKAAPRAATVRGSLGIKKSSKKMIMEDLHQVGLSCPSSDQGTGRFKPDPLDMTG
jgi:hypothetical protein